MEAELSHWKGKAIKWELPPSSIPTQVEPDVSPLPASINLAKEKKTLLQGILKADFNPLPPPPSNPQRQVNFFLMKRKSALRTVRCLAASLGSTS